MTSTSVEDFRAHKIFNEHPEKGISFSNREI